MRRALRVCVVPLALALLAAAPPAGDGERVATRAPTVILAQSGADLMGARGRLNFARESLQRGDFDAVERKLKEAEKYLEGGTAEETAAIREEIAEIRRQIGGGASAPAPATPAQPAPAASQPAASTADLGTARSRIMFARESANRGDAEGAERKLKEAEKALEGGAEAEVAPLRAEIREIRQSIAGPDDKALARAAEQVERAKAALADQRESEAQSALRYAEQIVRDVPDAAKASLLTEIEALKAKIAAGTQPSTAPTQVRPAQTAPVAAPPELASAQSRLRFARESIDSGDLPGAERRLNDAEAYLQRVPDDMAAPLRAELATLRAELEKAQKADAVRELEQRFERDLKTAESDVDAHPQGVEDRLREIERHLHDHATAEILDAAKLQAYRARVAAIRDQLGASRKTEALERASDPLAELEAALFADPFGTADERTVYNKQSGLEALSQRVRAALEGQSPSDPDVAAVLARIDAAEAKLKQYGDDWSRRQILESASQPLARLEGELGEDPFGDANEQTVHNTQTRLQALSDTARAALEKQPPSSPDVAAILARIDAADAKLKQYLDDWSQRRNRGQPVDVAKLTEAELLEKNQDYQEFKKWGRMVQFPNTVPNEFRFCLQAYDKMIAGGVAPTARVREEREEASYNHPELLWYGTVQEMKEKWCEAGLKKSTEELDKLLATYRSKLKNDKYRLVVASETHGYIKAYALPGGKYTDDPATLAAAPVWFLDYGAATNEVQNCLSGAPRKIVKRFSFDKEQHLLESSETEFCGDPPTSAYR